MQDGIAAKEEAAAAAAKKQAELEAITTGGFASLEVTLTLTNFLGGVGTAARLRLGDAFEVVPALTKAIQEVVANG